MSNQRSRQIFTVLLVVGAVVFGMVLAGGLGWSPSAEPTAQPEERPIEIPAGDFALPSFADLAERVSPAVVAIEARSFERARSRGRQVDPFEFFFGPRRRQAPPEDEEDREFRSESGGSGFVISADGLIVTNHHVIDGAEELKVHLGDDTFEAEVKGTDQATDLALIKIEPAGRLAFLSLGDSDGVRVGEWVMAVGSPLGLTDTVTVGVVSAKNRRIGINRSDTSFENFIQTDAAINFGNSGGPLINLAGQVVGINTAINWGSENIGFAVPVNHLKQILPQLRDEGRVRRGFLGIGVNDLSPEAAQAFGLESDQGVLVTQVQEDQPAAKAGLRHGDVIIAADGRSVGNTRALIDYVSGRPPGSKVELEIVREGERLTKNVTLAERPSGGSAPAADPEEEERSIDWLGIRYQDLTPGLRSSHELPEDLEGVWITNISPRSPFVDEGLQPRGPFINVITEVNGRRIRSVEDFEAVVRDAEPGSRLRVYVRRFAGGDEAPPVYAFPAVPNR